MTYALVAHTAKSDTNARCACLCELPELASVVDQPPYVVDFVDIPYSQIDMENLDA